MQCSVDGRCCRWLQVDIFPEYREHFLSLAQPCGRKSSTAGFANANEPQSGTPIGTQRPVPGITADSSGGSTGVGIPMRATLPSRSQSSAELVQLGVAMVNALACPTGAVDLPQQAESAREMLLMSEAQLAAAIQETQAVVQASQLRLRQLTEALIARMTKG